MRDAKMVVHGPPRAWAYILTSAQRVDVVGTSLVAIYYRNKGDKLGSYPAPPLYTTTAVRDLTNTDARNKGVDPRALQGSDGRAVLGPMIWLYPEEELFLRSQESNLNGPFASVSSSRAENSLRVPRREP